MFARGRDVIKLQQLLNKSAFISKLAEDGIFGRNTYHAVKIFQRHHGLNDDGIVGPETWRKLSREPFIRNSSVSYSVSSSSLIKRGKLTYDAEGNNIPNSRYYSRVIHWPGNEGSGVTLGSMTWGIVQNPVYCRICSLRVLMQTQREKYR
nr:peptidoglycan-binding protein [Salmonella enterica]